LCETVRWIQSFTFLIKIFNQEKKLFYSACLLIFSRWVTWFNLYSHFFAWIIWSNYLSTSNVDKSSIYSLSLLIHLVRPGPWHEMIVDEPWLQRDFVTFEGLNNDDNERSNAKHAGYAKNAVNSWDIWIIESSWR
jgi:hypothetical protein